MLAERQGRNAAHRVQRAVVRRGPDAAYPVCRVPLEASDRFLLYTDGVTETENAAGEAFGDRQLERVIRNCCLQPASELSRHVLAELDGWRPIAADQQDDITLIVVDVL